MIKQLIFIGIVAFFYACNQAPKENSSPTQKVTVPVIQKKYTKTVFLTESASKELNEISQFTDLANMMDRYYTTTNEQAKLNAKELSDIIVRLKDSTIVEKLNRPDVKARLNVLNNETLRLLDMNSISAITSQEVNQEIEKIIYTYESYLSKINQVYLMNANEESVDVKFQAPKVLEDTLQKVEVKMPDKKMKPFRSPQIQ